MALFSYKALTREGKKVQGTVDAATVEGAREQLLKMGMYPIWLGAASEAAASRSFNTLLQFFGERVSFKEKILFTKQLAVLLKAGVPLLQALELLSEQFEGTMRSIIVELKDTIKQGQSLAEGLARYPKVFDNIYMQLVRAGEASGKLELILERLVDYMEQREALVKKVKAAMRYPMIQLGVVILVVVALLKFVVPKLTETFVSQGAELPITTRSLMFLSDMLSNYWYIILGLLLALTLLFQYWKSTPSGALLYDRIKLKIPIVRFFTQMGTIVQFCRTLGMLIASGVNFAESLDIVVRIVDNKVLANALEEARDKIIKQGRIAEFLKQTNVFPSIAIYLINTGEQSGQLDTMLLTVAENYEADLSEYADTLSSLLEPIMLLVMAVIVGFVVLSVVQPMFDLISSQTVF